MAYYLYLDVLMPLPLSQPVFSYRLRVDGMEVPQIKGKLAVVPFGNKKSYTGLVLEQSRTPKQSGLKLKEVERVLPYPPVPEPILTLWQWAAHYYMCSLGDLLVAAVQTGFRPEGEQHKVSPKAALVLQGWLPSAKFMGEEHFQGQILNRPKKGTAVDRALQQILSEYRPGDKAPMTLQALADWLGVSNYVINKLRRLGVIERTEVLASELSQEALVPRQRVGDQPSALVQVGSSRILLMHLPGSDLLGRIPYDRLIDVVTQGGQALLLFPDIASLKVTLPRLQQLFEGNLYRYYSDIAEKERRTSWLAALSGESGLYIGLRAAVWLPLSRLSSIVVMDEEESGYRQREPAPRFTASNVALMLGHFCKVETLLISSTPSVESYTLALQRKYSFVSSPTAPKDIRLQMVSMSEAFEKDRVQGRVLSVELMGAVREAIEEGGMALLLYQRKGYARRATCPKCEASPKCPHCHTVLRYVESSRNLVCGMCGYYQPMPTHCPECGASGMRLEGTGVERLRRALESLYPGIAIKMAEEVDKRTAQPQLILSTAYEPPMDLLQSATTVGIVQLDLLTTLPDFRANERAYRYLTKCRDEAPHLKRMVVQYFAKAPNALSAFSKNDYRTMLDHELEERNAIQFSPFSRAIDVYFESAAQSEAYALAGKAVSLYGQHFPQGNILGPAPMPVRKKQTAIGYKVTLLLPLHLSPTKVRELLHSLTDTLLKEYRGPVMNCYFDVDPL
ncbi:MAG: primosomal protein N' [Porphyromonas sp.]|nr:primosomal protein N' [Porphyromonas sp.]